MSFYTRLLTESYDTAKYNINGQEYWEGGVYYYTRKNGKTRRIGRAEFIRIRDKCKEKK